MVWIYRTSRCFWRGFGPCAALGRGFRWHLGTHRTLSRDTTERRGLGRWCEPINRPKTGARRSSKKSKTSGQKASNPTKNAVFWWKVQVHRGRSRTHSVLHGKNDPSDWLSRLQSLVKHFSPPEMLSETGFWTKTIRFYRFYQQNKLVRISPRGWKLFGTW